MIDIGLHGGPFGGVKEAVKKIQHIEGKIEEREESKTINIETVNSDNTAIFYMSSATVSNNYAKEQALLIELVSDNVVRIRRGERSYGDAEYGFMVVEYHKLKSKQTGMVGLGERESKRISINKVDSSKSMALASARRDGTEGSSWPALNKTLPYIKLSDDSVYVKNVVTSKEIEVYWQVIEFL